MIAGWIPFRPHPETGISGPTAKQLQFLLLPDQEAFYGGAAGGGKSDALLMASAMFVDKPGYNAILFRKSLQDHKLPEGLIPRSKEWWLGKAHWNGSSYSWTFPVSGATLTFGYMDGPDDHYRYQSSAYQFIGFDEEPQFREYQVRYMFSRLRRLEKSKDVPLRIRGAGNPDGPGVPWVKRRYVDIRTAVAPFIPARLDDNPFLDRVSYVESLNNLDPVTRARLLEGDWEIQDVGSMFRRSWFTVVSDAPARMRAVRYWDKASTKPSPGRDPDYTSGVLMGTPNDGRFFVLDVRHFQGRPLEVEGLIKSTAELDRQRRDVRSVVTYMEQEPGSAGVDVIDHYTREVLVGFQFRPDRVTGPKEERAGAFSSTAEAGNVYLLLGPWDLNGYLDELESFPGANHDDRVDATSGAFRMLTSGERLPKVRHG